MLLHYRSVFRADEAADLAAAAREPFAEWLALRGARWGGTAADLSPGRRMLADGVQVEVAEGPGTARFRLRRSGWPIRRVTTLTAHCDTGNRLWLWLEREYEISATNVAPPKMHVPELIRGILRVTPGHDGEAVLTAIPQPVTGAGLDHLIDVLCDDERQVPVVVISRHPRQDPGDWSEVTRELTSDLAGVAAVYELDKEATDLMDADIAWSDHKVFGGAVRTYLPGVDPASPADAAKHRVLTAARILENPVRAKMLLTKLPWELARARPLPEPLQRVDADGFAALRGPAVLLQPAALPAARNQEDSERVTALTIGLERALAEVAQCKEEIIQYKVEQREEKASRRAAEDRAYLSDQRAQEEIFDHDATRAELAEALDQVRWLRSELVDSGLVERAYAPVPEDQRTPPLLCVADLRAHLPRLTRVSALIDWETVQQLDDNFKAATWAAKAWRALRALDDYAAARACGEFDRDFYAYCQQPPPGRTGVSANMVAITESDDTRQNRKFAMARLFPVPEDVHPDGKIFMWAHIKLDSAGRTAPRIHFYDDTAGPTGLIHIGYIGPHLPNRQT